MFMSIQINPLCGFKRGGKNKPDPADRTRRMRPPANRRDKKEKKASK